MSDSKHKLSTNDQWSIIQKQQIEDVKQTELLNKRQEHERKKLYRESLDQMVQQQNQLHVDNKQQDFDLLRKQLTKIEQKEQVEVSKRIQVRKQISECNQFNIQQQQLKNQQTQLQKEKERQMLIDKINEINKTVEQENLQRKEQKVKQQQILTSLYDRQREEKLKFIEKQKEMEKAVMQQEYQQLISQENARQQFMKRIRSNYSQNDEVKNMYKELYDQRHEKEVELEKHIINEVVVKKNQEQLEKEMKNEQERKQKFLANFIDIQKQIREKEESKMKQKQEQFQYLNHLLQNIQQEEQVEKQEREKRLIRKQQYLSELQNQISNDSQLKNSHGIGMSQQELAINKKFLDRSQLAKESPQPKQAYFLSVPGLTGKQDYQRQKQLSLIDRALNRKISPPNPLKKLNQTYDIQNMPNGQIDYISYNNSNLLNQSVDITTEQIKKKTEEQQIQKSLLDVQSQRNTVEAQNDQSTRQILKKGRKSSDYNIFADIGKRMLLQNNQ